jgi:hypothetical protein
MGAGLTSLLKNSGDTSASSGMSNLCAISTKRLWRSASVNFGGRGCIGFFIRFPNSDDWGS